MSFRPVGKVLIKPIEVLKAGAPRKRLAMAD